MSWLLASANKQRKVAAALSHSVDQNRAFLQGKARMDKIELFDLLALRLWDLFHVKHRGQAPSGFSAGRSNGLLVGRRPDVALGVGAVLALGVQAPPAA